ncbi:MAG: hypothetical protein DSY59_01755 [Persephonella sp.]|nr:MAG: hypothetical protein DSY60_03580 [Persephonella sp.]RUM61271.1 MAG: hypothetical protein DSY59_01755 [Persephonella sp.]
MALTSAVDKVLEDVANMHASDIILLSFVILGAGFLTYIILLFRDKKKPHKERRSQFVLFLIALNVSFFTTVVIFVYKVLVIGLRYLFTH